MRAHKVKKKTHCGKGIMRRLKMVLLILCCCHRGVNGADKAAKASAPEEGPALNHITDMGESKLTGHGLLASLIQRSMDKTIYPTLPSAKTAFRASTSPSWHFDLLSDSSFRNSY